MGQCLRWSRCFASDLSLDTALFLKSPSLPTKPCRTTSALVGKVAGQAKGRLQAYQADLLKDLDESEGVGPDTIQELDQATNLSLQSNKKTARAISHSIEALGGHGLETVNLSDIREKDKFFLLDAPLASSGLFSATVTLVVNRWLEVK